MSSHLPMIRRQQVDTAIVHARVAENIAATQNLLRGPIPEQAAQLAELATETLRAGNKLLLFGNGGSAADASHLAAELVGRFRYDRPALPALSLTDNASSMSAIGNDLGFERVFARQIEAFGQPGDLALGLTTSGRSPNVILALGAARAHDLRTAVLCGSDSPALAATADLCLCTPARDTARVQECHMLIGHIVCELVERALFPAMTVRLVLLDRDGTINRKAPEGRYVTSPDAVELLPGAAQAIRRLNDAGIPVAVVTNQRCVALGELDDGGLAAVHDRLREQLAASAGARLDAIFHCPHERGTCSCRKPEPGLLVAAGHAFGAPADAAVMIGDAPSDVEAGRRFGARTIQLTEGPSESAWIARDLAAAVRMVIAA